MFRTSKCSSSERLVHAVLWYFFHASIKAVWSMAGCAEAHALAHPAIDQTAFMDA
jgi:hypothetical protein